MGGRWKVGSTVFFTIRLTMKQGAGDGRTLEAEYALEGGEALSPFF